MGGRLIEHTLSVPYNEQNSYWRDVAFMVYEIESVILVKIGMLSFRTSNFDKKNNKIELRLNLDLLDEKREQDEIRQEAYKH